MSETDLKKVLNDFLGENRANNANLPFAGSAQEHLDELKNANDDLSGKFELWDKKFKNLLAKNGIAAYASDTELLNSITGKIREYGKSSVSNIKFDPVDVVAKRLTQSKEEFDFFDLQLYLYAKEKNAHIFSFNTQAFQEINDPVFLDYFRDAKVLHPYINFKEVADLDRSFACVDIFKTAIQNDLENDKKIVQEMETIKNAQNEPLDKAKVQQVFEKTTNALKEQSKTSGELRKTLEDKPLFEALDVFKMFDQHMQIDKQLVFNQQVKTLEYIEREFYGSSLGPEHFEKSAPVGKSIGDMLRNKKVASLIQDGLQDKDKNLVDFLKIFKTRANAADATLLFKSLYVESGFPDVDIQKEIAKLNVGTGKIPITSCPPRSGRRKRETSKCALTWENIDEINEERTFRRDQKKVQIDSEKFAEYLQSIENPEMRKQLIQFADQLVDPVNGFEGKILGESTIEVNRLISREKLLDHFSKLGEVSGALSSGVFAKSILADLLNENIEGVAVNVGFLAGDQILSKIASISDLKGAALAESGRVVLGNSFKVASPFIKRLGSALVVYDLVEQVQLLEKGDKDAVIRIVGDSIILGADAVEIGVGILEAVGVLSGVSGPVAPIVLTIGAVVFIGTDAYFAVKHVKELDDVLHLTAEEMISVGLNSIFYRSNEYLEELMEIKSANKMLAKQALEFLKSQENIQRFVFPSAFLNPETNRIQLSETVKVYPDDLSNIQWDRSGPDEPAGGKVFCAPQVEYEGDAAPAGTTYRCQAAMGIADLERKTHDNVLFNLSNTYATIIGFPDIVNVFVVGNGFKNITGGSKDDIFSLRGDAENTRAFIDGMEGDNTLDVSGIDLSGPMRLNLELRRFESPFYSEFKNVNKFIGRRQLKDVVQPDWKTKYINGQGGLPMRNDEIVIEPRLDCRYQLTIQLNTNTIVRNRALLGDFSYIIDKGKTRSLFWQKYLAAASAAEQLSD